MLTDLYGWTVVGSIITVLIGIGVGVLSMNPPHDQIGQVFISLAALLLIARGAWWIIFEQYSVTPWQRVSFIIILFGGVGLLWGESLHWLQTLQLSRTESTGIVTGVSVTVGKREPSVIVSGVATDRPYTQGTVIGGIKWQDSYLDTRINIQNPNDFDLDRFDVTIEIDLLIGAVGQISDFPGVSFFSGPKADLRFQDEEGRLTPVETSSMLTHQYRVHADHLLKKSTLQLVLAALPNTNLAIDGKMPEKLFGERVAPKWASVTGEYYVGNEKKTVDGKIPLGPSVEHDERQETRKPKAHGPKPPVPENDGQVPPIGESVVLISSMIIELRLTCEMKPGHELQDGEDSGVLSEHDFTILVGPPGKFSFPWVSPLRWWKQEDNRVVFVDRYALANTSDLIGRPVSVLSTFETLIVVPKMIRTGYIERATFAEVSVRVNGQEYWQMSQTITRPEFPRFGFEIPVSMLEEERTAHK
jgi:hypothetical protein